MKQIKEIVRRTHTSMSRLISQLKRKVRSLDDVVADQRQRLFELESRSKPSIQAMEQRQHDKRTEIFEMRESLNSGDLQLDLEKQYGTTRWARRLINELLKKRSESRVCKWPIA